VSVLLVPHALADDRAHTALANLRRSGVVCVAPAPAVTTACLTVGPMTVSTTGHLELPPPNRSCDVYAPVPPGQASLAVALVAGVVAGIVGDVGVAGPAWLVADTVVTNATRVPLPGASAVVFKLAHAAADVARPPMVDPNDDWIAVAGAAAALVAAATLQ
jgi:hypothetical protein